MVGIALAVRDRVDPGLLGVALVMMTSLGRMITDLIQSWTLLEISLGAIARIKHFSEETPTELAETPDEKHEPSETWPSRGAVEFRDVSVAYNKDAQPVLTDINLSIQPGEKIGLCGRTGRYVCHFRAIESLAVRALTRVLSVQWEEFTSSVAPAA